LEDDNSGPLPQRRPLRNLVYTACLIALALWLFGAEEGIGIEGAAYAAQGSVVQGSPEKGDVVWNDLYAPAVLIPSFILLIFSAFFSSSEVAFYSLHQVRLRALANGESALDRLTARLMEHPGSLLTSILMGNCIVNVLLGVVLAAHVEEVLQTLLPIPVILAYLLAVGLCTTVLVFFGEITPKLVVVRNGEGFARYAAIPIFLVDKMLMPLRSGLISFVGVMFRVTRFSKVPPAPFMTDAEFKSLLSEGEASGVIEEEERQMIQGILEFSDVMLREILVPRPDMVALKSSATASDALAVIREHECARIPTYKDELDSITGVLYAKDLLPIVDQGGFEQPIAPLIRKAHFVPETMTVADFVRTSQRLNTHLAIVVDEFGGTEGLVTLQDALREVVGDIGEEDEEEEPLYTALGDGLYEIDGGYPLDELEELTGVHVQDAEHTTVGGFLMDKSERILSAGDEIEDAGVRYTIEAMDGKRVSRVHMCLPEHGKDEQERGNAQ